MQHSFVNCRASKTGNTPIAQAFLRNARSIVEALIMCGADVIAANNEGWTPLHLAARKGLSLS